MTVTEWGLPVCFIKIRVIFNILWAGTRCRVSVSDLGGNLIVFVTSNTFGKLKCLPPVVSELLSLANDLFYHSLKKVFLNKLLKAI